MALKSWAERPSEGGVDLDRRFRPNGYRCPKCEHELYDDIETMFYTLPPQIRVVCLNKHAGGYVYPGECNFGWRPGESKTTRMERRELYER